MEAEAISSLKKVLVLSRICDSGLYKRFLLRRRFWSAGIHLAQPSLVRVPVLQVELGNPLRKGKEINDTINKGLDKEELGGGHCPNNAL